MTNPRFNPQFNPDCTKIETIIGWIWLVIHMFVLPLLLPAIQTQFFPSMTPIQANALYYGFSLAVVTVFGIKMLRR